MNKIIKIEVAKKVDVFEVNIENFYDLLNNIKAYFKNKNELNFFKLSQDEIIQVFSYFIMKTNHKKVIENKLNSKQNNLNDFIILKDTVKYDATFNMMVLKVWNSSIKLDLILWLNNNGRLEDVQILNKIEKI